MNVRDFSTKFFIRSKKHVIYLQQEVYYAMTLRFYLRVSQGELVLVSGCSVPESHDSHREILH